MYKPHKLYLVAAAGILLLTHCTSVKSYQNQYLNDHYMQPNAVGLEQLETEGVSFREGASGGDSGKTGGGCGCN